MRQKKNAVTAVTYAALSVAFIVYVFPFFLLLVNSFKTNGEILASPFAFPRSYSFDHIAEAIANMNFAVTFTNSLIISVFSVLLILVFSAMSAHYLVRNNTLYSRIFFAVLVASMIIPFQAVMIPLMHIYGARLGLITKMPIPLLIVLYAGFGSALSVFIYHGFIKSIPKELEEAAFIDGCTRRQAFFKIVLPMLKPTSMTILILNVMWIWNDYLLPSLILTKEEVYTMPIKMQVFNGTYMNNWQLLIPALLLTILPVLVVYFFVQKHIIEGVVQGSIK